MKVVLTGCTGHIGSAVLTECLSDPAITSLVLLSRREITDLPDNKKVKTIIIKDFTAYEESTIQEITTADAALWCLGTKTGDEKIDIDFPMTFIEHIKTRREQPFRFVQLGGAFSQHPTSRQSEKSLCFLASARRIRGTAEAKVLQSGDGQGFDVYLVRPGGVLAEGAVNRCIQYMVGGGLAVMSHELAKVMVHLVKDGGEMKVVDSREIVKRGRELLTGN